MVPSIRESNAAIASAATPVIPIFAHELPIQPIPQALASTGARNLKTIHQIIALPTNPRTFVERDEAEVAGELSRNSFGSASLSNSPVMGHRFNFVTPDSVSSPPFQPH